MMQRGAAVALLLVASCSGGQGQVICPAGTRPMYGTTMQDSVAGEGGDPSSVDLCVACYPGRFRELPAAGSADTACELCPVGKASGGGGAPCADCAAPLSAAAQTIGGVVFERSACGGARNAPRVRTAGGSPEPPAGGCMHDQPPA